MKFVKSKNANINYLAKIIDIQNFTPHPDPETTKLKLAHVDGFNIVVGIDSEPGIYVYFPTSSEINPQLLAYGNLYRHAEKNNKPEAKAGFFEDNGRVKAIKLRGIVSEGFLMEWTLFHNFIVENTNKEIEPDINTEFDSIEDSGKSFWICKKYIVQATIKSPKESRYQKRVKRFNRVIDTQFRFHYETSIYRKVPTFIKPDDLISITSKIHGTSGISAYVLCKKPKPWYKFWDKTENLIYDYLYSSRSVIKNAEYNPKHSGGFYGVDVWKYADDYVRPFLSKGLSLYYEIVGFLPNGGYIQKNYDYGCVPPKNEQDYRPEVNFKVRIYRITLTNVDGQVHEFSAKEVQQWCKNNGLIPVEELYYGYARDLYKDLDETEHWQENFIDRLANDKNFYMELNSPDCNNKVPHEGIVIKKEDMIPAAVKLKCWMFLNKTEQQALDAGEDNIEDNN